MTTELERLLELASIDYNYHGEEWKESRQEYDFLKSQIESKLAQVDEITNQELSTIQFRQAKTEIFELREENRNLKQELSQHKKLVDAIELAITRMKSMNKECNDKFKDYPYININTIIQELQNLLKESEKE